MTRKLLAVENWIASKSPIKCLYSRLLSFEALICSQAKGLHYTGKNGSGLNHFIPNLLDYNLFDRLRGVSKVMTWRGIRKAGRRRDCGEKDSSLRGLPPHCSGCTPSPLGSECICNSWLCLVHIPAPLLPVDWVLPHSAMQVQDTTQYWAYSFAFHNTTIVSLFLFWTHTNL